jgi:CDP-diacylglycerol--serine O-phosphatidyltransferase
MKFEIIEGIRLPDLVSICNLLVGLLGIWVSFLNLYYGCIAVIISTLLDGLDGIVSRVEHGGMGREMDSLADIVSFGILPSLLLLLYTQNQFNGLSFAIAGAFAVTGMLRLAWYNILQERHFRGIPITFSGLLVSLLIVNEFGGGFVLAVSAILAVLMISPARYPKILDKRVVCLFALTLIASLIYLLSGIEILMAFLYAVFFLMILYATSPLFIWRYMNEG